MAELKVRVKMDTTSAIQSLQKLQNQINKLNGSTTRVSASVNKISTANQRATTTANKLGTAYNRANTGANKLWRTIRNIAALYISGQAIGQMFGIADTITSAQNKFNAINAKNSGDSGEGGYSSATLKATEDTMNKIFVSAQKVKTGYANMMTNVAKSMSLAGDAFDNNVDNAIRFQEIMSEAYVIAGASSQEMSSSMYQMVQALGSGILQGEELRSIREGAPLAYRAIEEFAQGIFNTTESLKDLASQGKITSDIVVAAILSAGDELDTQFKNTTTTFAQAWTMIKNAATQAFTPVMKTMTALLNSPAGAAALNGIVEALYAIGRVATLLVQVFGIVFTWMAENWNWIRYIVYIVISALILYLMTLAAQAIKTFLIMSLGALATFAKCLLIAAVLAFIIWYIVQVANTAASGAQFIQEVCMTLGLALIAIGVFVALVLGNIVLGMVLLIIGIVLLIVAVISRAGDSVMGILFGVASVIWNIFFGLCVAIAEVCIIPLLQMWDAFANFLGNLFNDPLATIANLFVDLANFVLGILRSIAGVIDTVFGTNLASGITGWMNGLSSWAASVGNGTYEQKSKVAETVYAELNKTRLAGRWDTGLAVQQGAEVGTNWMNAINDFGGNLKTKINDFDGFSFAPSEFGSFNADTGSLAWGGDSPNYGLTAPDLGSSLGTNVPDLGTGGAGGAGKSLGNIDKNTGKMADSMAMTEEDVEYLRRIANMEWKKEFTTAEIKVDMNNYNTVNGNDDLDGIATRLADKLYSELDAVANGVYA